MNANDEGSSVLDQELNDWIADVFGTRDMRVERRSGGASRAGYAIDVIHPDGSVGEFWLRIDTGYGPQSTTIYTVRREAAIYRALEGSAVRVPRVVAVHSTRDAFLAERLSGRNWFAEIHDPGEQIATARDFMTQLAAIHALDVNSMTLPELGPPQTIHVHVLEELAIWEEQYREGGATSPVLSLAFAWLRAHLPPDDAWPVVLVQGDTGPGNFLYANGRVIAVMDWEMAHWGDLHDDFGWLCVRDVQERFTHLPDRFADYVAAGGRPLDLDRLRYFRVLAQTRCAVGTRRGLLARDSRGEIANHLIYSTLHLRLLTDALAEAVGVTVDVETPPAADATDSWLFDIALDDLRNVIVPALAPGFPQQRAKGVARVIKYLRSATALGRWFDEAERRDLSGVLGGTVTDLEAARTTLCLRLEHAEIDHGVALGYCVRHTARATELARDAMGALADRRYSPIT